MILKQVLSKEIISDITNIYDNTNKVHEEKLVRYITDVSTNNVIKEAAGKY
jgi:hypothetical protein